MTSVPLSVVAGYLGAGKTTFINRLLSGDHGLHLLVLVNDFGAINIDASLIASAEGDTIALTNGCVCCTMGADLFMALGDALDRSPRPHHIIVEASGVADPTRIANAALAEPDLTYAGILTVVDGTQIASLCLDPMIGAQVRGQISCADMVLVSKLPMLPDSLADVLRPLSRAEVVLADALPDPLTLLAPIRPAGPVAGAVAHPAYTGWSYMGPVTASKETLETALATRPAGLFRVKGFVRDHKCGMWEVHAVGQHLKVSSHRGQGQTRIVAIGLSDHVDSGDVDTWWRAATA